MLTVADETYSDEPVHEYRYDFGLPSGIELRSLSTGDIVLVDTVVDSLTIESEDAELPTDVDPVDYQEGLQTAMEGMGPSADVNLKDGEAVVGAFATEWAVDANGEPLETTYRVEGNTLIQQVDVEGATFPVVADPIPLIVIALGSAVARVGVSVAARAFATTTIRVGIRVTSNTGFRSFPAFKAWAGNAKPGYQWHHIVEQSQGKFAPAMLHNKKNLVQIPTRLHQKCVNSWMAKKQTVTLAGKSFNNRETIRAQVRKMDYHSQLNWGIRLLQHCGVKL